MSLTTLTRWLGKVIGQGLLGFLRTPFQALAHNRITRRASSSADVGCTRGGFDSIGVGAQECAFPAESQRCCVALLGITLRQPRCQEMAVPRLPHFLTHFTPPSNLPHFYPGHSPHLFLCDPPLRALENLSSGPWRLSQQEAFALARPKEKNDFLKRWVLLLNNKGAG